MKKYFLLLIALIISMELEAQSMIGLNSSNNLPLFSLTNNPSHIADNPYNWQLSLGFSQYSLSDAKGLFSFPLYGSFFPFNEDLSESFDRNVVHFGENESFFGYSEIRGPAVLIKTGFNSAFAITSRLRGFTHGAQVPTGIFQAISTGNDDATMESASGEISNMVLAAHSFSELAFSYAQTVYAHNKHAFNAGFTVKRVNGINSFSLSSPQLSYNTHSNTSENQLSLNTNELEFKYASANTSPFSVDAVMPGSGGSGWGFDLGFTYEYRPKYHQYQYLMDGKNRYDNTENKYLLKASLAFNDIGSLRYGRGNQLAGGFNGTINAAQLQQIKNNMVAGFQDILAHSDRNLTDNELNYQLPTNLVAALDIKITGGFYTNLFLQKSMSQPDNNAIWIQDVMAFSPRLEAEGVSLTTPVQYEFANQQWDFGAHLQAGPFLFGIQGIGNLISAKKHARSTISFGINLFNISTKKKDKDMDGVSDKFDECIDEQGIWEFRGCPDTDLDGIEDRFDLCFDEPGLITMAGCPDSDKDGIADKNDICPELAGEGQFFGCPDTDKDGVPDYDDDCPLAPGVALLYGCPDTDNDGIKDTEDMCPEVAGVIAFNGCPDTDKDGISDDSDLCPKAAGLPKFSGCPDTDADGVHDGKDECPQVKGSVLADGCPDADADGVRDALDECPDMVGDALNAGCPAIPLMHQEVDITVEEEVIITRAEQNLKFENDNTVAAASGLYLEKLAQVLSENERYKLLIIELQSFYESGQAKDDQTTIGDDNNGWGTPATGWEVEKTMEDNEEISRQEIVYDALSSYASFFYDQVIQETFYIEDIPQGVEYNKESKIVFRFVK